MNTFSLRTVADLLQLSGMKKKKRLFVAIPFYSYFPTQYAAKLNSRKYRLVRNMSSPAEFLQYSEKHPNILEASVISEQNTERYAGMQDVTAALERDGRVAVHRQKKLLLVVKQGEKQERSGCLPSIGTAREKSVTARIIWLLKGKLFYSQLSHHLRNLQCCRSASVKMFLIAVDKIGIETLTHGQLLSHLNSHWIT